MTLVDDVLIVQTLNMHEVEMEEEIHIYIDVDPNIALLQMKMIKCCTRNLNVVGRSSRIKYFPKMMVIDLYWLLENKV